LLLSVNTLRDAAIRVLAGVGDPMLGEWFEVGDVAFHLRRRLAAVEARRVGDVCDVRGTADARRRFERMRRYLPNGWTEII
jgi:hypothetical protein